MSDEKFKFDLDVKDAVASAVNLKEEILKIGDSKNLSGLIQGFTTMAGPVAAAGAAIYAMKASLDLAKEGEEIERIHKNFDEMAKGAGQSSNILAAGIEKSVNGMVDMEDAMKAANKVMYDLGPNAAKIPEMFELARKAGKVFGGETTENFEKISMAITTGNARMLRSLGLNIDSEAAQKKYALSIGKTVETLTAFEKQQATLNAVMDKGNEKFKGVSDSAEDITSMMKQMSVAMNEFKDTVALAFGKSDFIKERVQAWRDNFNVLTDYLKGKFGSELEQSNAKVDDLSLSLNKMKLELSELQSGEQGIMGKLFGPSEEDLKKKIAATESELNASMTRVSELNKQQNEETAKQQAEAAETAKKNGRSGGPTPEELAKQKQAMAQFHRELLQIKETANNSAMALETDETKFKEENLIQQSNLAEQYEAKINEIKTKAAQGNTYSAKQAAEMIKAIEEEKTNKIKELQDSQEQNSMKVYDNQVHFARTAKDGMIAAGNQFAAQNKKDAADYGKQGQQMFGSVKNNAIAAFKAMGDGSKSAGEAMKGFLLNSIADYVEMKGQALLLEGLWPVNPIAIAAGGGLVALSAAMRSAAGGSGGGKSAGGTGGGAPASAVTDSSGIGSNKPEAKEQQKKSVTIQVQGNYFETEQSKQRMMDMIRENTDATDFKYQQIGVN